MTSKFIMLMLLLAGLLWLMVFALPVSGPVHPDRKKNNEEE